MNRMRGFASVEILLLSTLLLGLFYAMLTGVNSVAKGIVEEGEAVSGYRKVLSAVERVVEESTVRGVAEEVVALPAPATLSWGGEEINVDVNGLVIAGSVPGFDIVPGSKRVGEGSALVRATSTGGGVILEVVQ